MSRGRWAANGTVRIYYLDSGGAGPPIVFVPGFTDVADDYLPILGDFGRRFVVMDLRGRGRSDTPAAGYALADHAADIAAVIGEVTDGPVHLMSFSRGTCYALAWGCAHPDRVLSVAIADYPAREIAFPNGFRDDFLTSTWRGTPVSERLAALALTGVVDDAVGHEFWSELAALGVPTLVVRSAGRSPVTDDDWRRYRETLPQAEFVVFEDSPHDVFRPDRLRYPRLVRELADRADTIR